VAHRLSDYPDDMLALQLDISQKYDTALELMSVDAAVGKHEWSSCHFLLVKFEPHAGIPTQYWPGSLPVCQGVTRIALS